ncbi:MAG: DsbA family protein, partial [Oceanicaulis sp.]|nr:DsbA family protein [Oceanicaulis sp.]
PRPGPGAAPDPQRLDAWAAGDARLLAAGLGLAPPPGAPEPGAVRQAEAALAGLDDPHAFSAASAAIEACWRDGSPAPGAAGDAEAALARGAALRGRLGHYQGAVFHFEGEWYWGLDRLGYLEERLAAVTRRPLSLFAPRLEALAKPDAVQGAPARTLRLEAFISLRSPYTWLAMDRLTALADAYGAQLVLRPVLPMVMRGLPVPRAKRLYIVRDAKREAERLGLPFGRIADPLGRPAERGLAVLFHALRQGRGAAFARSFLAGVFAEGVDAGARRSLDHLAARAGLGPQDVTDALADTRWRDEAEANREAMLALGVWGVPSFRVNERPARWGQDRLWAVEADLRAESA